MQAEALVTTIFICLVYVAEELTKEEIQYSKSLYTSSAYRLVWDFRVTKFQIIVFYMMATTRIFIIGKN